MNKGHPILSITFQSHNLLPLWYLSQRRPLGELVAPESFTQYQLLVLVIKCYAVILESKDFHADVSDILVDR